MVGPPTTPDLTARKAELRRELRERRRAFVATLGQRRATMEFDLGPRLLERIGDARAVALTRAVGAEIDPLAALARLVENGRVTALPVALPHEGRLAFHRWQPGDALLPGPHGIDEPAVPAPVEPDVIVLPLLGFDRRGGRLGQGGGYYDRTLARRPSVRRIGLAWSCQEVDRVPTDAWDLPLDAVLTEAEWIPMPIRPDR